MSTANTIDFNGAETQDAALANIPSKDRKSTRLNSSHT